MTRRVLMGQRGGSYGFWVSKPGADVVTAAASDLLWSTDVRAFQIVKSGVINSPANNSDHDFTIPDLGFVPVVLIGGLYTVQYRFPNPTTLRIHVDPSGSIAVPVLHWAVTNQPILH